MKASCLLLVAILIPAFAKGVKPAKINIDLLCQNSMQYVFAKDVTCKWMFLPPSEAHQLKNGKRKIKPDQ